MHGIISVSLAAVALASITAPTSAQSHSHDSSAKTSTLAGVYTTPQAERGREAYAGMCKSCHSPASHAGATFEKWWKGKTLGDLFGFMSAQMPKNDPGSLSPEQYADVVAYLLKLNALPVGKVELPPDSAVLAKVRIDLPKKKITRKPARKPLTHSTHVKKGD